ncbi:MAG TPA: deoxyribodipyrimidine photo-lyase [Bacteroidales bacterium]
MEIAIFWFRRDLRINDNLGLHQALKSGFPVLPLFIFDRHIVRELPSDDARISFIFQQLEKINNELAKTNASLLVKNGEPFAVWQELVNTYSIKAVFANHDYEPYAIDRDSQISRLLLENGISLFTFKDQVIFEKSDILKSDGQPYTVFTPFKNKWLEKFKFQSDCQTFDNKPLLANFLKKAFHFPSLQEIGFTKNNISAPDFLAGNIEDYELSREIPWMDKTTHIGPHLRFGTVSIREIVKIAFEKSPVFLSELIWREFFMMILYHFPQVVNRSFKPKFERIKWLNNEEEFEKWKSGKTGYPLVDAGMRQLNETGFMHNRVRMVTASFLCKHLLIDWRWGEAWFAEKLLDYELSSNNGNWQWAAGTGCDATPYFRVFNPTTQLQKFDPEMKYVNKWLPELYELSYPSPIVEHNSARERAILTYKNALNS